MKIISCYKWVLDEADLQIDPTSHSLLKERAKYKISEYDKNAIECGVQLVEDQGGEVIALTVGADQVKNSLKEALSRGPERAVYVKDPVMEQADSNVTAKILAAAVQHVKDIDLVICGEGSSDEYAQQVGPRIAQLLGLPVITFVNKVTISNGVLHAERKVDEGIEVVEASLPAVITVLPEINEPRIPSLKQILASKKKPVEELTTESLGIVETDRINKLCRKQVVGTVMERKNIKFQGEVQDIVSKTVDVLKREGFC